MKSFSQNEREKFSQIFNTLSHPRRIAIFRALQKSGRAGSTYGGLAKLTNIADPSLAHHLKMMKAGGLVRAQSKGATTVLTLNRSWSQQIQKFLNS